jgi:hypothetical protein
VGIKNIGESKTLIAGTKWMLSDEDRRTVVTGRKNEINNVDAKDLWILEKISRNIFRIRSKV